jgi:hypothetical protein
MLTCPYPPSGGQLTFLEATKPLRAAENGENYKNNMHNYKILAPAGGYGFKAFNHRNLWHAWKIA